MRLTNLESETRVADLLDRLYDLRDAPEATKQKVRHQLFEANPHLEHDLRRVPRGTLILVPDVAGLDPATETGTGRVAEALGALLQTAVAQAGQELDASVVSEVDDSKRTLEALKSRELRKVLSQAPELLERLPAVAEEAKGRAERAEAARAMQSKALATLSADLEAFLADLSS